MLANKCLHSHPAGSKHLVTPHLVFTPFLKLIFLRKHCLLFCFFCVFFAFGFLDVQSSSPAPRCLWHSAILRWACSAQPACVSLWPWSGCTKFRASLCESHWDYVDQQTKTMSSSKRVKASKSSYNFTFIHGRHIKNRNKSNNKTKQKQRQQQRVQNSTMTWHHNDR